TLRTTSSGHDIAVDTVTAHAGFNNLTLDSGTDITIGTLAVGTTPGTLNLMAAGTITENAGGAIKVATLTGNSGGTVKLAEGGNTIGDLGTFTVGGSGDFNLNDGTTALSISGAVTVPGVLTLNAGSITEVAGGSLAVGTLTGTSAADVKLTNPNQVHDLGAFTTAGDFNLNNGTTALTIDGTVQVPGTLTLSAGDITELTDGTVTAGTLAGSSSGAVALDATANDVTNLGGFAVAGDFNLNNGGNGLNVTGTVKVPGTLTLDAGSITETGAGTVTAGALTGGTAGAVALDANANAIDNLGKFSATDFNLDDGATALNIRGAVSATGTLRLAAGSITEQSGGTVAAATLTGSTTGDTTLTQAGNDIAALDNFTTTAGNFSLTDGHELEVAGNVKSGGTISLTVPGPELAINGTLTSAGATAITAQAGTSLVVGSETTPPATSLTISDASLANI